ncbi:MAG: lipoyl synthase, partial [Acidobacteriota bacterium]
MSELPVLPRASRLERPPWLKVRLSTTGEYEEVQQMMRRLSLVTVCEEARCPNIHECWARERTATFMLMGDVCTRTCGFCAVGKGAPGSLDPEEPERVAEAVKELGLSHAVVTSVNRDDLEDGGAGHFAATIRAIRRAVPACTVEVLIPDFCGNWDALDEVLREVPEILNHNLESVERLYRRV